MIFGIVEYSLGSPGELPTSASDGKLALQAARNGEYEWKLVKYSSTSGSWVDNENSLDRNTRQLFYDEKSILQPLYVREVGQDINWVMSTESQFNSSSIATTTTDISGLIEPHVTRIKEELQSMSPTALIELYELDLSILGIIEPIRFHAGTNGLLVDVKWQNKTYNPLPVEAEGFASGTIGALPRPKIKVANIDGAFSVLVEKYNDLQDCKLTRKKTFVKYLDKENFPNNYNPDADPNQHFPDDIWYVDQKISENRHYIEWELSSPADLTGVMLPARVVAQNYCSWRYKSAECGYDPLSQNYGDGIPNPYYGRYFDNMDIPTNKPQLDFCAKRLSSCNARFQIGNDKSVVIPFGGFPGATRY